MRRSLAARGAIALVIAIGSVVIPQPARLAAAEKCSSPDRQLAVVTVHGWHSGKSAWDALENRLEKDTRVFVSPFDYEEANTRWVTDKDIGPKLARKIECLGRASKAAGGPGKVVLVAHSLGGLAIRQAASESAVSGGEVGKYIAGVIPVGTPERGAHFGLPDAGAAVATFATLSDLACNAFDVKTDAAACALWNFIGDNLVDNQDLKNNAALSNLAEGSSGLNVLPKYPSGTAVHAIDGKISIGTQILFLKEELGDAGDGVVPTASARAFATSGDHGGTFEVTCKVWSGNLELLVPVLAPLDTIKDMYNAYESCFHTSLQTNDAVLDDIEEVVELWATTLGATAGSKGPGSTSSTSQPTSNRSNSAIDRQGVVGDTLRGSGLTISLRSDGVQYFASVTNETGDSLLSSTIADAFELHYSSGEIQKNDVTGFRDLANGGTTEDALRFGVNLTDLGTRTPAGTPVAIVFDSTVFSGAHFDESAVFRWELAGPEPRGGDAAVALMNNLFRFIANGDDERAYALYSAAAQQDCSYSTFQRVASEGRQFSNGDLRLLDLAAIVVGEHAMVYFGVVVEGRLADWSEEQLVREGGDWRLVDPERDC